MKILTFISSLTRLQKICLCIVLFYVLIALLANVIANDKPLYCVCNGITRWPAIRDYGESLRVLNETSAFDYKDCTSKVMPFIPYSANTLDPSSNGYSAPMSSASNQIHVLGTDALGKDVLAGLIHGTSYVFIIGILSSLFAFIPGVLAGLFMGYWQNHKLRMSMLQILYVIVSVIIMIYESIVLLNVFSIGFSIFLIIVLIIAWWLVSKFILSKIKSDRLYGIPIDNIGMRLIEIFESFPKLLLLMSFTIMIYRPTIFSLICMIAFIRWPIFAQISRAQTLKVSQLNYTLAAENIGVPWHQILFKHIWPNIKSSLWVTAVFSFSAAVLLEASLSFLGLGLKLEQVSWGSLLNEGRQYFPGWWLSVFPGLAIFILIVSLNWLMEKSKEPLSSIKG